MRCPVLALVLLGLLSFGCVDAQESGSTSSSSIRPQQTSVPAPVRTSHKHSLTKSTSTIHGGVAPFKTTSSHRSTTTHFHTPPFPFTSPSLGPVPTRAPPDLSTSSASRGQSGWLIFLEVAGALVGLGVAAALARCFWSYRKTPRYRHAREDSIQQIRRELRESRLARLIYRQPPPPYEYAPEYETRGRDLPRSSQISGHRVTFQDGVPSSSMQATEGRASANIHSPETPVSRLLPSR